MRIRTPFIPIIAPLLLAVMMCLGGCATIGMEQVKSGMTPTESSDSLRTFNSACLSQAPAGYCEALEKNTRTNGSPFQEFSTHDFMVLDYPIDAGTLFLKMHSPRHTAALSYCHFVSRGSIDQKKAAPSFFGMIVGGFAISSGELPAYEVWLKTDDGMQCRQYVENSIGLPMMDLSGVLENKLGLVALNPSSLVWYKADSSRMMKAMEVTLNHERIHIIHANCPAIDVFAKDSWANLDPVKKAELKKDIPEYNWENQKVAVREFLAFTYENDPSLLLDKAKSCTF